MTIPCPLCTSPETTCLETIFVDELNYLYEHCLGITGALKASALEYMICKRCGLGFFSPIETGDEYLYEQLQTFDWYYMSDKNEYRKALDLLPKQGAVLEVGSGQAAFASLVGADRYTGLEFNNSAIEKAKNAGITLLKETVEQHAGRFPESYEAVVSFQVLEHIASPTSFIRGCVNSLKPGGILILAVPARDGFVGQSVNRILDMPPHHVTHWSEKTLHKLADLFGLHCLAVEYEAVSDYHRAWARKVVVETAMRKHLGIGFRLIDRRLSSRLLSKTATLASRLIRVSLVGIKGHTVVACYEKPRKP